MTKAMLAGTSDVAISRTRIRDFINESDEAHRRAASRIARDLRTPLTSIKGFAATLRQTDIEWTEQERLEFLRIIEQETDRLGALISELTDMHTEPGTASRTPEKRGRRV